MRGSTDPKYQHLQEDLHVEITAFAPPGDIFEKHFWSKVLERITDFCFFVFGLEVVVIVTCYKRLHSKLMRIVFFIRD